MAEACCPTYQDVGKEYLKNARERFNRSPWESFLYGVALTMTRQAIHHNDVLKVLNEEFPSREEALEKCRHRPPAPPDAVADFCHGPSTVMFGICDNAREEGIYRWIQDRRKYYPSWHQLEQSLHDCDLKGVRKHWIFQQHKGPDMLLLESGCQVPVMDVWALRHVQPEIPRGEAEGMSYERWARKRVQNTTRYDKYRRKMIQEAEACGRPVGEHHVSCWFEMQFGSDKEIARDYYNELVTAMEEK